MINSLENTKTVIDKHKCTLCGACYNVCPNNAIEFIEDKDGFVYPSIIQEKCTGCGLCEKKCPSLNTCKTQEIVSKLKKPVCYGGYTKNEEVRKNSSSGGVFSILANYVLAKGGYVCGAKFIKGGILEHVIIDNIEDLAPLRGSKYVQSHVNDVYIKIKELLNADKYMESLEIKIKMEKNREKIQKEKNYFLGIPIFKKNTKKINCGFI